MTDIKQKCRITGKPFLVTESEQQHIRRIGENHPAINECLPLPTVHPLEFHRQIYSFGNFYNLYWTKSALSEKPVLMLCELKIFRQQLKRSIQADYAANQLPVR